MHTSNLTTVRLDWPHATDALPRKSLHIALQQQAYRLLEPDTDLSLQLCPHCHRS